MCQACRFHTTPDSEFADRLLGTLNSGMLMLMISIGHRTGLFDTLHEAEIAIGASDLAERAGLDERYVREWLGAMVAGRIVLADEELGTYWLPPEHAEYLTRAHPRSNMAVHAQYAAVLGGVEDDIVRCFRDGGGVPYERYPRFHAVMAEDSGQTLLPVLTSEILGLVPGLADRLSAGAEVLDLGCGSGRAVIELARCFPRSRFTGIDFSPEAVRRARASADEAGVSNAWFILKDAATLDDKDAYDLVTTFDAVHDQADPARVLANIRVALKPDGVYLMQDIQGTGSHVRDAQHPLAAFIYTISCMHCMTVSLASGGLGLGAAWGKPLAERMLRDAGFASTEVRELPHDPLNYFYISRKA